MANIAVAKAQHALKRAETWIKAHKSGLNEVVKAGEAAGLPFVVALAEGRLANDGSGHVEIGGVPVMLLTAAAGTVISATGYADEFGPHIGSAAAGCWGAFAADAGRQIGLKMRAKAGLPIQAALISRHALDDVNKYLASKGLQLKAADTAGARVGGTQEQIMQVGAEPVFTAERLAQISDNPTGE